MRRIFKTKGHNLLLETIKIDNNTFNIAVFKNEKHDSTFTLSLMPVGDDKKLSTYQLTPNSQIISEDIIGLLPEISDWIISFNNKND